MGFTIQIPDSQSHTHPSFHKQIFFLWLVVLKYKTKQKIIHHFYKHLFRISGALEPIGAVTGTNFLKISLCITSESLSFCSGFNSVTSAAAPTQGYKSQEVHHWPK